MAKSINKVNAKDHVEVAEEEPAAKMEVVEKNEETLESSASSGSDSDSDSDAKQDDIEGLALENDANEHQIKKLEGKKQNSTKSNIDSGYSSIIYVSRLPDGFHERELSKYFAQFGDLKQVRLARNKKSGNTRHYGFIEFANKEDAKVAQETMNNYLLMGHLLQVRLLPKGSKIEKLYKHKKRIFMQTDVKKSADELKENAKNMHTKRMDKLAQSGIEFKW